MVDLGFCLATDFIFLLIQIVLFVEVLKFLASDQNSGGKWKCFCGAHGIER